MEIFILIGLPGSGKSTWVKERLQNATRPTTVVSSDDILEAWGREYGLNYSEAFSQINHHWLKSQVNKTFDEAVARGDDIILDRTNMSAKARNAFLSRTKPNTKKTAVVFSVPHDVLMQRLKNRAEATGKTIPGKVITDMMAMYNPPTTKEFDEVCYIQHR